MNCPYCSTPIDKHEAKRCLDAWIYRIVFDHEDDLLVWVDKATAVTQHNENGSLELPVP